MTVIEHFISNRLGIEVNSPLMKEITTYLISEEYEPLYKLNSVPGNRVYVASKDYSKSAAIYKINGVVTIDEDVYDLNDESVTYGYIKTKTIELSMDGESVCVKPRISLNDGLRVIYAYGKFGDDTDGYFVDYTKGDGIHGSQKKIDFKTVNYFSHEFKSTGIWTTVTVRELEKKANHLLREIDFGIKSNKLD